jgi:stage II sporulation SpoE-like protein
MHRSLAATRGAAAAVAVIERERGIVRFAGVGNVCATIELAGATRSAVSHHGTLGHDVLRFQEFTYPWSPASILVLHSDGVSARWRLGDSPGLAARDPALIAGVLLRDHQRERDDATVLVVKDSP